jgi:acyl-CoA thioesterase-1
MSNLRLHAAPLLALQLAAGCSPEAEQLTASAGPSPGATESERKPAEQKQEQPHLVLAFGDSLYAGFGLAPSQAFPAALERALADRGVPARVVNAGVSGDTSAGGLRRLPATLDRLGAKPDLAIVGLGANDALRGFDPAETRRNLDGILAELDRRGIPVLLTGITAPPGFRHPYFTRYEGIYAELARRHGAELEPSFLEGVLTRPELLLDGLHPNAAGTQVIAERVAPLAARSLRRSVDEAGGDAREGAVTE